MAKKITNVTHVKRHFLDQGTWRNTLIQFMKKQKDHKCELCGKSFSYAGNLKTHINVVHNGYNSIRPDSKKFYWLIGCSLPKFYHKKFICSEWIIYLRWIQNFFTHYNFSKASFSQRSTGRFKQLELFLWSKVQLC